TLLALPAHGAANGAASAQGYGVSARRARATDAIGPVTWPPRAATPSAAPATALNVARRRRQGHRSGLYASRRAHPPPPLTPAVGRPPSPSAPRNGDLCRSLRASSCAVGSSCRCRRCCPPAAATGTDRRGRHASTPKPF